MMTTKKSFKYLPLMLVIIMLIASFTACSKNKYKPNEESGRSDDVSVTTSESSDGSDDDKSSDKENSSQTDVSDPDESRDENSVPDPSEPEISQPDISDEPIFVDVTRIEFESTVIEIDVNTITPIVVNVYPESATNKGYTLTSSDESILTVMLENVMGSADGEVTLTVASVSNPEVTATCRVVIGEGATEPHVCSFEKNKVISATCTTQGYSVYKCVCGATENRDIVDPLGHSESEWRVITEATTVSEGLKRKSCTRCGTTLMEESIPKIVESHTCSFSKSKTVSATCTEKGYTIYKCSCGKTENRDYVSALGHEESNWVTITEATTASTGLKRKTCTRCGVTLAEEEIDKLVEDPDAKYMVPATAENTDLLEERILYYLNLYRVQDGVPEATALLNGKTYKYAKMRAEQLVDNFAHDTEDIRAVATELEFGVYVPEHEETYYDWETDTVISTGNVVPAYYQPGCSEAICGPLVEYNWTVDHVAKVFAQNIYESEAHWSYVGAATTKHITVGLFDVYGDGGKWYMCIATSVSNEYD